MSEKTVYTDRIGGISERWVVDGDQCHVQHSEDATHVIDAVGKANLHGTSEIEGLGRLVAEIPLTVAMEWAQERGIPWEKLMYSSEYDTEFKRMIANYTKLQYAAPVSKVKAH